MSKPVKVYSSFEGGLADFNRSEVIPNSFAFARSVDFRTNPQNLLLLPRTIKESGSVIVDLLKWGEVYQPTLDTYMYGNMGYFYRRTSAGVYTNMRQVANSHGNGLVYSPEDDFIYYTSDKVVGRYGPLSSTNPTFVDDFFGSQGGVPLNTNSLDLESSSSQYADRADTPTLSITGNLAIDLQVKPESLPTVGNTMTLVSKWNESGATRSYKFDIATVSGYFGDGSDSSLTISSNTTESPIDSAATATVGTTTISATNVGFAAGQQILIHQSQGTGAGTCQRLTISSYTAGTITTVETLNATYTTGAQVRVIPQYTSVTIDSGFTYRAKPWNGTTGGILVFICSGVVTISAGATITASGSDATNGTGATGGGFRGGNGGTSAGSSQGFAGEGTTGLGGAQINYNGNGGGGGLTAGSGNAAGAGGGNGTSGQNGSSTSGQTGGIGGITAGSADLTTLVFGGGGGGGAGAGPIPGGGGSGGGIIWAIGATISNAGTISANGGIGYQAGASEDGGSGAGGSILLQAQTATLGTGLITATGGAAGVGEGGNGGNGRIHLDYYTSYSGTTNPTLDVAQDSSLVTNTTYQLRLALSSTGSNSQTLSRPVNIQTNTWQQLGVSWQASTGTATFFLNAVSIGTATGAFTSISDNGSRFAVGANFNSGGSAANFYDGLIDEVRLFNMVRSESQMSQGLQMQIASNTAGLVAYYQFNGSANDATSNSNNLTLQGSPVYSIDVPYPSPTTRADIDQTGGGTGNTYAVPTSISEASTDKLTFTPAKDPQKGIQFNISDTGSGDWTVTIHDQYNNVIATSTVTNANLHTGTFEFVYSQVWSPLTNFTQPYHAHITATAGGTPKVVSTVSNDLTTAQYTTYFQFLMTQTEWHPLAMFLNFWVVGNGHYVGNYNATLYEPNLIDLGAGWVVRSFAYWREYLAIGVQWGQNIYDSDRGRIYFWDGISPTYNFFIDVPEGGINAMKGAKGLLNLIAGWQGFQMVYRGGDSAEKVKQIPLITAQTYTEVYPGAITMWKALLRYGVAGNGDTTDVQKGVYSYGAPNLRFPDALSYDYPISTGNYTGTSVKVGMVVVVNKRLLIGWQDNVSFGVDYVDDSNPPFPTGTIEFLITDDNVIYHEKEANVLAATYSDLETDQGFALKYRINSASAWVYPDVETNSDSVARANIGDGRYKEIQVGVDITASATASPTLYGVALERDLLENEERVG